MASSLSWRMAELCEKNHVPHSALCEITWRCNLNCQHCYLPEGQRRKSAREADELSTVEWKRVFDEMADLGVLYLTLSGGEVFMRPDFLELVAHARKRSFDLRVFTTGTLLTPKAAQALVDHQVGKVEISLYGKEETHDALVQIPGAFARSVAAGRVLRKGGITVVIKCPLMNMNIADYPFLIALANAEGFRYKFDPTVVPRDDKDQAPLALRTFDEELKAAFRDPILRLSAQGDTPEDHLLATPVCEAGRSYLSIGPGGDVYPCIEWRTVLGNVRENSVGNIWTSPKAQKIANLTREDFPVCNSCELLSWCPRCTGLADREDGDAFGPSREACHLAKLNYETVTGLKPPVTNLEKSLNEPIAGRANAVSGCAVPQPGTAPSGGCGPGKCGGCGSGGQATAPRQGVIPISLRS